MTTVPMQALYLMNNAFVHEQSRAFASRLLARKTDRTGRIQSAWQLALGRPAGTAELERATRFLDDYLRALAESGTAQEKRLQAAWSGLARTLLIRNEFLFVD